MNKSECQRMIKLHEGFSAMPYVDTQGKTTIGWGWNLTDNGIPLDVAQLLFDHSFNVAVSELEKFDWYNDQPDGIQEALVNMSFNLGISRLLKFKKLIAALERKDYAQAAAEALDSRWARQVGRRSKDIARLLEAGR